MVRICHLFHNFGQLHVRMTGLIIQVEQLFHRLWRFPLNSRNVRRLTYLFRSQMHFIIIIITFLNLNWSIFIHIRLNLSFESISSPLLQLIFRLFLSSATKSQQNSMFRNFFLIKFWQNFWLPLHIIYIGVLVTF